MGDELEGPYKILVTSRVYPAPPLYSIAVQRKRETLLKMYIPDAGDAESARHICNLLNKNYKEVLDHDTTDRSYETGIDNPDQRDGYPRNSIPLN